MPFKIAPEPGTDAQPSRGSRLAPPSQVERSAKQHSLRADLQDLVQDPTTGVTKVGSLHFQGQSSRPPAKWARVKLQPKERDLDHQLEVEAILKLMTNAAWSLHKPCAMISVTGTAKDLETEHADNPTWEQLRQDFERGLREAVQATNAWVSTGGTATGVMQLVGHTLRNLDKAVWSAGRRLEPSTSYQLGLTPSGPVSAQHRHLSVACRPVARGPPRRARWQHR